jgi:hypothetical protein
MRPFRSRQALVAQFKSRGRSFAAKTAQLAADLL